MHQLAVIGRQFPLSLIRQVVTQPEEELYRLLAALQRKEFLYEQPAFPEVDYLFKHALTQEVAYGTVLQERRKALHERTAQAIEALYRAKLEDHYSELAHHYSRSGNTQRRSISASGRATGGATVGLCRSDQSSDRCPGVAQEPTGYARTHPARAHAANRLGVPLAAIKGFAAPEVERVYTRARELCGRWRDTAALPGAVGTVAVLFCTGGIQTARDWGNNSSALAQRVQDPYSFLRSMMRCGETLFFLGEFAHGPAALGAGDCPL